MQQARDRIPRFTTEWTNFNPSDPGTTLVELHAWMTETILHEMNRVPELNYIKFLDLLGIHSEPARSARTEISFTLDNLDQPLDALVVPIPIATQIGVDDKDIKESITFETDRSLLALNAHIGLALAPAGDAVEGRQLVAGYAKGTTWLHSFDPFGSPPAVGRCFYLGLLLRPNLSKGLEHYLNDALPAGPLDLFADAVQVYDRSPDGSTVLGPLGIGCAAAGAPDNEVEWQIWTGADVDAVFTDASDSDWTTMPLSADATGGLAVTGHLVLEVPAQATAVSPRALDAAFWASFEQAKPPSTFAELKAAITDMDIVDALGDHWEAMGVVDPEDREAIAACGRDAAAVMAKLEELGGSATVNPSKLSAAIWAQMDPAFEAALPMAGEELRPLYWVRAKLKAAPTGARPVAALRSFELNTVPATQAVTRLEDRLGVSDGRPGQVVRLPKTPVLIDLESGVPVLELVVGAEHGWTRVDDFFRSGPDSAHYLLDPATGEITFGDGLRGRVPIADAAFVAARYRVGGGAIGNVGPGTIVKLKGRLGGVRSATNLRAAHDGTDAESLDAVKLRAPHELRHRDRAVTSDDFSDLALRTPGVALHRVQALPRRAVQDDTLVPRDGAVTLVLLPASDQATPQPSEAQLQAVCRWLEPRRLVTTEIHLTGPTYAEVRRVDLRIEVADDADVHEVSGRVFEAVQTFLHPIRGGSDGSGWEFGAPIYHAELYERVLAVPGVARASGLELDVVGGDADADADADVTRIPARSLPALTRDKIHLVAGYA
ncbi:MAG: putative baseplate assembly protein [Acidimicrobiia bacterium]